MSAEPIVPTAMPSTDDRNVHSHTPLYASAHQRALRVACVMPARVPAWLARLQELAAEHDWLEWTSVPVAGLSNHQFRVPGDLRAFLRHERSRRPHGSGAFAPVALPVSVQGADLASVQARLAVLRPDLIVLMGAPDWVEALAPQAALGCWTIDDTLGDADAAAQALLWPLLRGETATAVELELASPGQTPIGLATSWGSTCQTSATQQCEHAFRKIPALVLRALRGLQQANLGSPSSRQATLRLKASPLHAGAGIRALARTLAVRFGIRWQHQRQPFEDPWFVLIRQDRDPLDPERPDITRFQALTASAALGTQIWADPCSIEAGDRKLIFVEECTPDARIAHIACLEVPEQGPVRRLGVVLDRPYHLSFPQVFRWEGTWYMTVESGQARCVTLYRAQGFPMMWQPMGDLLSGRHCVDPVLHHHEGRWYLFANIAESGGSTWDELFLFVADTLTGPYVPHPANPIVADVRRARPAGRLFLHDGRLIRPAQDCAASYGAATVFNEVLTLSPTQYRECPLGRLDASWVDGLDGCHTYSATGRLEVLDARGVPRNAALRKVV
ncbi:hypothetical protein J2X06_001358 [Lysobacter niastensis]|uniref:Glucosamine inositolphosphorylceramide transferase 1 N-terminal domain-containing protein n=2 Tax=Lysobacter niastensis TaxID=380629 RepID=A0ABU1W970_9GAMM|nr:hypothetical protein [Lysobacter niastensis]